MTQGDVFVTIQGTRKKLLVLFSFALCSILESVIAISVSEIGEKDPNINQFIASIGAQEISFIEKKFEISL